MQICVTTPSQLRRVWFFVEVGAMVCKKVVIFETPHITTKASTLTRVVAITKQTIAPEREW